MKAIYSHINNIYNLSNLIDVIAKLTKAKPSLSSKYHIDNLGVFGSYTRNEQNDKSDIDILVEFSEPIGLEFVSLPDELEKILGEKVDLVSKKAIKDKYLKLIEKDLQYV